MDRVSGIAVSGVSKRYGNIVAVEDLSFEAHPGQITGFLGPNGAGKTTTMRILLGLATATSGSATIGGRTYTSYPNPAQHIGASLDAEAFHPGRTARNHLRILAAASGAPSTAADKALEGVGLSAAADRRVGTFSLGMKQRLGIASALLNNPSVLVLDEPANGLDPEGIRWMRDLLRYLAGNGATILLSSHLLTEVQQIADEIIIINHGRLVAKGSLAQISAMGGRQVHVDSPEIERLGAALLEAGMLPRRGKPGLIIPDVAPEEVSAKALEAGIVLSYLNATETGLEEAFLGLVGESR